MTFLQSHSRSWLHLASLNQKSSEGTFLSHICFQTFYISNHCSIIETCDNQKGINLATTVGEATIHDQALQVFIWQLFLYIVWKIAMLEIYLAQFQACLSYFGINFLYCIFDNRQYFGISNQSGNIAHWFNVRSHSSSFNIVNWSPRKK